MRKLILIGTMAMILAGGFVVIGVTTSAQEAPKNEAEKKSGDKDAASNEAKTKTEANKTTKQSTAKNAADSKTAANKNDKSKNTDNVQIQDTFEGLQSLSDLEDDVDENLEDENVKVIYKNPESCKEFTLYLEHKARKIEIMEKMVKRKERLLEKMQKEFESLALRYQDTETRLQKIIQHDPSNLKDNPELAKMIKMYETFSAEQAAERLRNLDLDLTLAILKGMKPKNLSKILTAMEPKLSAAISSQIVRGF